MTFDLKWVQVIQLFFIPNKLWENGVISIYIYIYIHILGVQVSYILEVNLV